MTKTVGEIAAENPSSMRVFERFGIDYCCGGNVSLAEACRSRGIGHTE
jgi:regulator of cell morphogenesis and NO signaling